MRRLSLQLSPNSEQFLVNKYWGVITTYAPDTKDLSNT